MGQPFHGDEVAFPECAKGVLEKGKPIFDFSIFRPNHECLWHPPLYIYLMALSTFMFGKSAYSFRLVSAIFNLFTIILVYLITKEVLKKNENKEIIAIIASFIYALNPLTIQSSIIMDIDGGLLNFFTILFIYLFIKNKNYFWMILSLLLIFLSKETGPVLLFGSIFLFYTIQKKWKDMIKIFIIFLVAFLLYLSTFFIYASIFDLDFSKPFSRNLSNIDKTKNFEFYASLITSTWSFKTFFYFVVPFLLIIFIYNSIKFYQKIIKDKKIENENLIFLNLFSSINILFFAFLGVTAWGFPKYYIGALPGIAIFIAGTLNFDEFKEIKIKNLLIRIIILLIILSLYFILIVKDPLLPEFDATARVIAKNNQIFDISFLIFKTFVLYIIIPLLISLIIFSKSPKKILLILILLTIFIYFYINILHTTVDYSTYSKYGDYGIPQVLDHLKNNNISGHKIVTYPNIGYYLGMSNYYDITYAHNRTQQFKDKVINNKNISYMIIYERDIDRIGEENMNYFDFDTQIGTYYIYKRK
jgi:hypothetical protein